MYIHAWPCPQVAVAAADPARKVQQLVHGLRATPATASKLQQDICDLVQQYSELMTAADPAGGLCITARTSAPSAYTMACTVMWGVSHVRDMTRP